MFRRFSLCFFAWRIAFPAGRWALNRLAGLPASAYHQIGICQWNPLYVKTAEEWSTRNCDP